MNSTLFIFAQTPDAPSGIAALGLNVQYFLFQLISFVIVLLVLRRWVFPKLIATLEARRAAVEQSLEQAKEIEVSMHKAEKQIAAMLHEARSQAEDVVDAAHKEAAKMVEAAEAKATQRAQHIVAEAKTQMETELRAARESLKKETAQLVAAATGQIIQEKVDAAKDAALIARALQAASKEGA